MIVRLLIMIVFHASYEIRYISLNFNTNAGFSQLSDMKTYVFNLKKKKRKKKERCNFNLLLNIQEYLHKISNKYQMHTCNYRILTVAIKCYIKNCLIEFRLFPLPWKLLCVLMEYHIHSSCEHECEYQYGCGNDMTLKTVTNIKQVHNEQQ